MQDPRVKNNYFTSPSRRPPKSKDKGEIADILEKNPELPYVHTANVAGAKIQLRTNSMHIFNFWRLNWYPSDSKNIDGVVYVVKGVEGYDPHLYYNLQDRKILIVNSEYYGSAKSAGALGLAGLVLKEKGAYPIHGACVGIEKEDKLEGVIIIAPTGTGKTTQLHELLYNLPTSKVHSDDYVFVFFNEEPIAKATEKQLYMRTDIAEGHPTFIHLFHDLPLENVVTQKEKCAQISEDIERMGSCYRSVMERHPISKACVFDKGADRCYWSFGNSRVMFPRSMFTMLLRKPNGLLYEAFKGNENVIDEAIVKYVILMTRDDESPPFRELTWEEAIGALKEGKYTIRPGAGPPEKWGMIGYEPFYDPYPPEMDLKREEEFHRKLYDSGVLYYMLNTGSFEGVKITTHQTHMYIRHIIGT